MRRRVLALNFFQRRMVSVESMRAVGVDSTFATGAAFIPAGKYKEKPSPAPPGTFPVDALCELSKPLPEKITEHDLLIKVKAAGVNPLDFKERTRGTAVSGYDVAGDACSHCHRFVRPPFKFCRPKFGRDQNRELDLTSVEATVKAMKHAEP